jgi:hypothetical protein
MWKYGSLQPETIKTSSQEKTFVAAVRKKKRQQTISDIFVVVKYRFHVFWDPEGKKELEIKFLVTNKNSKFAHTL